MTHVRYTFGGITCLYCICVCLLQPWARQRMKEYHELKDYPGRRDPRVETCIIQVRVNFEK